MKSMKKAMALLLSGAMVVSSVQMMPLKAKASELVLGEEETIVFEEAEGVEEAEEVLTPQQESQTLRSVENSAARTLAAGRTLTVRGTELVEAADGTTLTITGVTGNSEVACEITDGVAKLTCARAGVTETLKVTVSNGTEADLTVSTVEGLNLLYNDVFSDMAFDGNTVYTAPLQDARLLSQVQDSLEISMTFQYEPGAESFVKLFEISDSQDNYSTNNDNAGGPNNPANSTIAFIVQPSSGYLYLHTGAYSGSTPWQKAGGVILQSGKYYTLTVSVSPEGLRGKVNGASTIEVKTDDAAKKAKEFVSAFFGSDQGAQFKDWRDSIDTITVGGFYEYSSLRHGNYGNFTGKVKSFMITDGGYSVDAMAENHKSGSAKAYAELQEILGSVSQNHYTEEQWAQYTGSAAYTTAAALTAGSPTWEIYEAQAPLQAVVDTLKGDNFDGIGAEISNMFDENGDNTWLFAGGVETQGRFQEVAGMRNYMGQFEEYVRWTKAGATQQVRQRYTINVGKAGQDLTGFEEKLTGYISQLDPKAVVYMIGREDYEKGAEGIDAFKSALGSVITKALAMKDNTGYAVIQLPHAVTDSAAEANVELYAEAAKDVIRGLGVSALDRVVLVDHLKKTDTQAFLNGNYLTESGLLNGAGHYEIAKQFSERVYGSTDAFPTITDWTAAAAPEEYPDVAPNAVAGESSLAVTIPEGQAAQAASGWSYQLEIGDMTIGGTADSNSFTIGEIPASGTYRLTVISADGTVKLHTVTGSLESGSEAAVPARSDLQDEIRTKAEGEEPLTWLFMGDSITHAALWTNCYDGIAQNFEKYVKEDLGRTDDLVINTAVSSADTKSTLDNIEQRLTKYAPDIVSIMIGTNDVAVSSIPVETYTANLKSIVGKIRESNNEASIIFRTPTPSNDANRAQKLPSYIAAMKQVAEEDGNILVIDQYADWLKEMTTFPYLWGRTYYFGDNLHPNAPGQLRMAQQFIRECGLETDTPIANLTYQFRYTETNSTVIPEVTAGADTVMVNKSDLQSAYSQGTMGSIQVTLTDETAGKTYTQTREAEDTVLVMRNLPTDREYKVKVTAMLTGTATRVTFQEQTVRLEEGKSIAFDVVLDNTKVKDTAAGTEVGTLSVSEIAPEGTYTYTLTEGEGSSDNGKFRIQGNKLVVGETLETGITYQVRIKADNGKDAAETALEIATMPTLESVRKAARASFTEDQMALDLDLSKAVFDGTSYVDLGLPESDYYADGAYLAVLNNLREKSTGGTIIYRFRTSQENVMIFGAGSSNDIDQKNMIYGVDKKYFRGVFRTRDRGLFANFAGSPVLSDNSWHTVALSFDTTKADYQNQILISIDGSDNLFTTASWWRDGWQSWFNVGDEITNFAIGGGNYAALNYGNISMPALNGAVSFVTVTDEVYTAEELKLLSETILPVISGEQSLSITDNTVNVPENAKYTATSLTWDTEKQNATFVLTADGEAVFDEAVTVNVTNAEELGFKDMSTTVESTRITVKLSKKEDMHEVFQKEEMTFQNGTAIYGEASLDSYVNELKTMETGSVTVRYKLTDTGITIPTSFFSVSNGSYVNAYTSLYVTPSTGTIGYEVRTQNDDTSTNLNTGAVALNDVKNTNWHTVTYVFSATGTKLYFDGECVITNTSTGFLSNAAGISYARLGSTYRTSSNTMAYPFTGEMNYVQVTGKVLSPEEVAEIHKVTSPERLELPETAVKTEDMSLFYANYDNSQYYRIPTLFTTSKGTTIAGIDKRQSGSGDYGNIDTSIRRSTDNGATWGAPQILFNQPAGSTEHSLTIDPSVVEDKNGRIHLFVDLFPESRAAMAIGLLEAGSGFKTVGDKQYPILRDYANTASNASATWTTEYTIRENGVVWKEVSDGTAEETNYRVPNYLSASGGGELYEIVNGQQVSRGNIYIYTGSTAGTLKVPRVMNIVTCYSDDDGATWTGYKNITGMVKKDWMMFLGLGPGVGICLKNQENESLNGRLIVPVYTANASGSWTATQSASFIYSDDNGETWEYAVSPLKQIQGLNVESGSFGGQILTEAQVVEMNDGTLKMFCRNNSGKVKVCTAAALPKEEGGVQWSTIDITDTPEVQCQLSAIHYPELVDGKEAVILANPAGGGRNNGYVRVGLYDPADGTFDWKYGQLIKEGAYAYSCATILPNGNIGVLYEGAPADTVFTSMNLEWLTAPRFEEIEKPEITNVTMERTEDTLTFTVSLSEYMLVKGEPILKLLVGGVEKEAAYVSGNASKELVFTYDVAGDTSYIVKATNIGTTEGDTLSFVEGARKMLPEDVNYSFELKAGDVQASLKNAIATCKDTYEGGEGQYTEATWNVFTAAYEAAEQAVADKLADEKQLSTLVSGLLGAYEGLKLQGEADKEAAAEQLQSVVNQYKSIYETAETDYTAATWNTFAAAYTAAGNALTAGDKTAAELAALQTSLENAYGALKLQSEVDKEEALEALSGVVNEYKNIYETAQSDYTAATWNAFAAAYTAAGNALEAGNKTAAELAAIQTSLKNAYGALKLQSEADKEEAQTALSAVVDEYKNIYKTAQSDYTAATWSAFAAAYAAAEEALTAGDKTAEQLNDLKNTLTEKYAALKTVELEEALEQLKEAETQYKGVHSQGIGEYTESSWNDFIVAYEKVQEALKSESVDAVQLIQLRKELEKAAAALTKKTEEPKTVKLAAPSIKTLKSVAGKKVAGVKITVNKVANADSYTVYRKYGSNKPVEIGKTNASGVVYDKAPVSGKTVSYYAVADSADSKYVKSDNGPAKSLKLQAATKKLTAKQISKQAKVKLTWKKTKGAKGFVIYRSAKKNSGYTRIKVIKSGKVLSYTDKKVKAGKKYYYKIVVRGAKNYSGYRTAKVVKVKK